MIIATTDYHLSDLMDLVRAGADLNLQNEVTLSTDALMHANAHTHTHARTHTHTHTRMHTHTHTHTLSGWAHSSYDLLKIWQDISHRDTLVLVRTEHLC